MSKHEHFDYVGWLTGIFIWSGIEGLYNNNYYYSGDIMNYRTG